MDKVTYPHRDGRNFASLDVVKGICHPSRQLVLADGEQCREFDKLQKCRHCKHFIANDEYLGSCGASKDGFMAYPDMTAVTCGMFDWRE